MCQTGPLAAMTLYANESGNVRWSGIVNTNPWKSASEFVEFPDAAYSIGGGLSAKVSKNPVDKENTLDRFATPWGSTDDDSFHGFFDHAVMADEFPVILIRLTYKDRGLSFGSDNPFSIRQNKEIAIGGHLSNFATIDTISLADGNV